MKYALLKILFLSSLFSVFAYADMPVIAKTREIKTFTQVLDYVKDQDTVLMISVDNALLKSPLHMGERAWFYHRKAKHLKSGLKEPAATEKALAEWTGVLNLFGQQIVADDIAKTIDQIQKKQIKIMGVSSRGLGLASLTVQHLAQAGIDLGRTSGVKQNIPVILGQKLLLVRNGILFTSGVGKAIALKKLADLTKVAKPKKIVWVSHDQRTLDLVAEGMRYHNKGVEFIPLRYTIMDEAAKKFNSELADVQFESLMNVLSDEQAASKLKMPVDSKPVAKKQKLATNHQS